MERVDEIGFFLGLENVEQRDMQILFLHAWFTNVFFLGRNVLCAFLVGLQSTLEVS